MARFALETLQPRWVATPEDWCGGISIDCPAWPEHRHELLFENPGGGADGCPDSTKFHRVGTSFATLSLTPLVNLPGCFRGWVLDGVLWMHGH